MIQAYKIGQVRWKLQGVSCIVSKCHEVWSTNGLKMEVSFYPTFVNFAFYFIAGLRRWHGQQTELNQTVPNGVQWIMLTMCGRKVGVVPLQKTLEPKDLHLFGFLTTSRLNGKCLLNGIHHRQLGMVIAKHEEFWGVPYIASKFHELWSTNGLKWDRSSAYCMLCCPASHTEYSNWYPTKLCQMEGGKWSWCYPNNVAPYSECKCNHQNYRGHKTFFKVSTSITSGDLQWQYIVNSHIF